MALWRRGLRALLQMRRERRRRSSSGIDWRRFRLGVDRGFATKHVLTVVNKVKEVARFRLTAPPLQVFSSDLSARVDVGSLADGHVRSGRNESHGWFARIVSWDPIGHRDVVCGVAKVNRDCTFQIDEQLRSAIVEGEDFRLW